MREIKFRAWFPVGHFLKMEGGYIYDWQDSTLLEYLGLVDLSFPTEEFTGAKDINGVDIYENDFVLCNRNINDNIDKYIYLIRWANDHQFFGESESGATISFLDLKDSEVVGNIHEVNKQKMEQEDESSVTT